MATRQLLGFILSATAIAAGSLSVAPSARCEEASALRAGEKEPSVESMPTGLVTDRLTGKRLRIWRDLEQIALAQDKAGLRLHPKLHALWRQAQASGHAVYVEMPKCKETPSNMAGEFKVEQPDPTGRRHKVVFRLFISLIDRALVESPGPGAGVFVPFRGLGKGERYAEVFAHELAQAIHWLTDPEYAARSEEYRRAAATLDSIFGRQERGDSLENEKQQYQKTVSALADELEKCPHAVEEEVWRELLRGQQASAARKQGTLPYILPKPLQRPPIPTHTRQNIG